MHSRNLVVIEVGSRGPSKWEFTAFDVAFLYTQVQGGVGREHLNLIPGQTGMSS